MENIEIVDDGHVAVTVSAVELHTLARVFEIAARSDPSLITDQFHGPVAAVLALKFYSAAKLLVDVHQHKRDRGSVPRSEVQ